MHKKQKKIKTNGKAKKVIVSMLVIAGIGLLVMVCNFYKLFYSPNITLKAKGDTYLYIPTASTFSDVLKLLDKGGLLINKTSFEWVANRFDYPTKVKPGRYLIKDQMNNKDLVLLLRSGRQTPVKFVINSVRTKEQLVARIASELEPDSGRLIAFLNSNDSLKSTGFTTDNVMAMFLPNTYELYWCISSRELMVKMKFYYDRFWTAQRLKLAEQIPLTPIQVTVLASIVEQETKNKIEQSVVAGVYINRLKKGIKLEADPTLVYALGDFGIRRVLNVHKEIDSPYNTYKYTGLPPGPICMPALTSIDAVLNYKKHDYYYFCAREDFSGCHNFAKNYKEQMQNAQKYRHALNLKKILN